MKQQRRNGFFTFIFSFMPGAAEMYMGFLKQGVSIMAIFLLGIVIPNFIGLYDFNMVTIVNRRPKLLGLKPILEAFVNHQREVVRRRTEFDLKHAKARYHIVEGLIKCISILDEVIKTIRASKNKSDAKDNLVKEFKFSEAQAEAIVTLQLYRLTNTDIIVLQEEKNNLEKIMAMLEEILGSPEKLNFVIKEELRKIKKEYEKLLSEGYIELNIIGRCNANEWMVQPSQPVSVKQVALPAVICPFCPLSALRA